MALDLKVLVQRLQRTLAKMDVALGSIRESIVWTNQRGIIEWCNASFDQLVGRVHLTEVLQHSMLELLPLSQNGVILEGDRHPVGQVLQDKPVRIPLFEYIRDGQLMTLELSGKSFTPPGGERLGVFVIRDVTQRMAVERHMNSIARFPSESPTPIMRVQVDGKLLYANAASEPILEAWNCTVGKHLAGEWLEMIQAIHQSGVVSEKELKHDSRSFSLVISPTIGKDYTNIYGYDVTRLRFLEVQLVNAQRLESIGQLAAGIAHEINTPTQYVGDNVQFFEDAFKDIQTVLQKHSALIEELSADTSFSAKVSEVKALHESVDLDFLLEEIPKAIEQSREGISRTAKIVQSMKEFSHPGTDTKTKIDINKAIRTTIDVSRNEWKYMTELEVDLDSNLPLVPVLPGEFNQVVLNIIVNACHAIADQLKKTGGTQGKVSIRTRTSGDYAQVFIEDTGGGIPESIQKKVFDPFFTTKEVGKGTGQGLAMARSIVVDKHQGNLRFEVKPGVGTTFIIEIPLIAQKAPQTPAEI